MGRTLSRISIIQILIGSILFFSAMTVGAESRGLHKVTLQAQTSEGQKLQLYKQSHALLVGVSRYTNGWPNLDAINSELDGVQAALEKKGFNVRRVMDPDSQGLKSAFTDFIDEHGYTDGARLLFYFSGHGHSDASGKGFLVPADAPLPENRREFLRKSLPMSQVMAWARQIDTSHALFLFDSCFSGSIFKTKSLPSAKERFIRKATAQPVRQFITAGSAGELVPARSVFTPVFINAISAGTGDLNGDGYITGSELGLHLSQEVPEYSDQSPQYGKIKDYDLAQGDFVFFSGSSGEDKVRDLRSGVNRLGTRDSTSNAEELIAYAEPLEAAALKNIQITNADRKQVWEQLNSIKWAIETRNMAALNRLSDLSKNRKAMLSRLMQDYQRIEIDLPQLSESSSQGKIFGKVRIKRMIRPNGDVAFPAKNIRDSLLTSQKTQRGWSLLSW